MNWFFVPISHLTHMSFCTQGLPGVAESNVSKSEGKPSPREKVPVRADEGWGKVLFPGPHPPSATVPPLPKGEGYFLDDGFCDFAFGSAQNDRVGGILRRVKVFGLEKPTEKKSGIMCIGYELMLRVLA